MTYQSRSTANEVQRADGSMKHPLERLLERCMVGQKSAISSMVRAVCRKETGWVDSERPLVFLLLGPTGTGKTMMSKQVAKYLHKNNKDAFIRLDMSEFQERHAVSRFVGPPPGYVGHSDGGQLTEALRKCNNALVLFDEVEKAHPEILTVLLQLFDEGRITDSQNSTYNCADSIFIMTSNLANAVIETYCRDFVAASKNSEDQGEQKVNASIFVSKEYEDTVVLPILKKFFMRDEFISRIGKILYFMPFTPEDLRQLVINGLSFWKEIALGKDITLSWDEKVVDLLLAECKIQYGARAVKNEIEQRIIDKISARLYFSDDIKNIHINIKKEQENDVWDLIIEMH